MAKIRKSYLGGAASTTTSTAIASSGTNTFNITAYTGWPYGTPPFFVVLEPGTANEEKVLVTRAGATDLTLTVYTVPSVAANRGLDGTSAVAHASGSTTFPVFTATEADEANELVSTMTTKGDLLSHGTSTFARLGVGTDTYVLKADSAQATGLVWGQVAAGGIATDAVTTVKIQDSAVTSAKIADGTIVNADINASAAIVDTKLATISTASKVSNSATTAASANTASAIVARDASGNFTAGTVTATTFVGALTGAVTGNVTGNVTGTAATVTTAAQPAITSVGTLSGLTMANGTTIVGAGGSLDFGAGPPFNVILGSNAGLGNVVIQFNGVNTLSVGSGNVVISGSCQATSFITASDYRLKENIIEISDAIERIKQLRPVKFQFKDSADDVVYEGFLAHEVQDIAPYAVKGEKDAVTDEGDIKPQMIDMSKMVGLLTAGIKELEARISQLEANQ